MKNLEELRLNPGYLKLDLLISGVHIHPSVIENGSIRNEAIADGLINSLDIIINDSTPVAAPLYNTFLSSSPYLLEKKEDRYFLIKDGIQIPVQISQFPDFYFKRTRWGTLIGEICSFHGNLLTIFPMGRCKLSFNHMECIQCEEMMLKGELKRSIKPLDEIMETIETCLKEKRIEIVHLSMGYVDSEDRGIFILQPYIRSIRKNFGLMISVDAFPPKINEWIDWSYAIGVDSIRYNMFVFDPDVFSLLLPLRSAIIGRERYLEALEYATTAFPSGAVSTNIFVGLESVESTIQAIDYLTKRGIIPILPIFNYFDSFITPFKEIKPEDLIPVYIHLYKRVRKNKLNMNWIKEVSIIATPIEGRFFSGESAALFDIINNLSKSSFGIKIQKSISNLRRFLRVKKISED